MKKIFLTTFCFCSFLLTAASGFAAQGYTPGAATSVIQEIATGTGPVTKAEYDKFWQQLGMTKREDKEAVIGAMRSNLVMTQEYQSEIWKCAEQAWMTRVVPPCKAAKAKFEVMKVEMKKVNQEASLKSIEDNANNLLQAAAKREALKSANGVAALPLTLETIRATKKNMDTMLARFEQVLRPQY